MSQFFIEYGLFLLKVVTIVAAIVVIIAVAASASRKANQEGLEVESINSGPEQRSAKERGEGGEETRQG